VLILDVYSFGTKGYTALERAQELKVAADLLDVYSFMRILF